MKNIFTSACLFLVLLSAQAQTATPAPEQLRAQAAAEARVLAQKAGLNGLEYLKIKDYTLQKLLAREEANRLYAHDTGLREEKLAAIEVEFLQKIVATLTPKQHLNYVAMSILK